MTKDNIIRGGRIGLLVAILLIVGLVIRGGNRETRPNTTLETTPSGTVTVTLTGSVNPAALKAAEDTRRVGIAGDKDDTSCWSSDQLKQAPQRGDTMRVTSVMTYDTPGELVDTRTGVVAKFNETGSPGFVPLLGSGKFLAIQIQGPSIPVGLELKVAEVSCQAYVNERHPTVTLVYDFVDYCRDKPRITNVVNPSQTAGGAFRERFGVNLCA